MFNYNDIFTGNNSYATKQDLDNLQKQINNLESKIKQEKKLNLLLFRLLGNILNEVPHVRTTEKQKKYWEIFIRKTT